MSQASEGVNDQSSLRPERCLSLTISGPWGHFRRIEGNVVKQTYRVIPRTTVAGLLAAVLGIGRDEYYHLFGPDQSWVAIEPVEPLRTVNMPMNTLSTAKSDLKSLNGRGKISVKLPDPTNLRQQHNYEVLVDPAYRIDVAFAEHENYRRLKQLLNEGKSHYVPSLGLSEHLAEIEYHGEFDVEPTSVPADDNIEIDSTVPGGIKDIRMDHDRRCQVEESPAFMQRDENGRSTTAFTTYAFNPDGGSLTVTEAEASTVDDRRVVFV